MIRTQQLRDLALKLDMSQYGGPHDGEVSVALREAANTIDALARLDARQETLVVFQISHSDAHVRTAVPVEDFVLHKDRERLVKACTWDMFQRLDRGLQERHLKGKR